ncbi:MAG: M1 family metallopeptidase [Bacteroidota bacterium]
MNNWHFRLSTGILLLGILFPLFTFSQNTLYFQQKSDITIDVTLDDVNHFLLGKEKIMYQNNSPDTLKELYFHLWPNAYSNSNTALSKQLKQQGSFDSYSVTEEGRGFIDSLNFTVNDKKIIWKTDSATIDICKLILNDPLLPGSSIIIQTPFRVKIPDAYTSRMGHDDQSYRITQWYPKPAVYDCYGWHAFPYLEQGEFYSEFGNVTVNITLPENYVVAASGKLQNDNESIFLDSLAAISKTFESFGSDPGYNSSSKEFKTLTYKAENVHDFAWFANKRFFVKKNNIVLESGKAITLYSFYLPENSHNWANSIQYMEDGIRFYSKVLGDYPYDVASAVDGDDAEGGGMEYPGIVSIGNFGIEKMFEEILVHELGHIWIYGALGSNEREHPWLDEGVNTYYENRYMSEKYSNASIALYFNNASWTKIPALQRVPFRRIQQLALQGMLRKNNNQAANLHSENYSSSNYNLIVYMKTGMMLRHVEQYLGKTVFDRAMQKYYSDFCFKHPYTVDLRLALEGESGRKLGWFFDTLMKSDKKVDYKILKVKRKKDVLVVTLKNRNGLAVPFSLTYTQKGSDSVLNKIWINGFTSKMYLTTNYLGKGKLLIDEEYSLPEIKISNNFSSIKGLCKKSKPIRLKFLGEPEDPFHTQIFYAPIVGYNRYNGIMAGLSFYNSLFPFRKLNWMISPMYGFNSKTLAGSASLEYSVFPKNKIVEEIHFSLPLRSYTYDYITTYDIIYEPRFFKAAPELRVELGNNISCSGRFILLKTEEIKYPAPMESSLFDTTHLFGIYKIEYNKKNAAAPFGIKLKVEQGADFLKSSITSDVFISYNGEKKGLSVRAFAGGFVYQSNSYYGDYNFRMSGWQGYRDYLYEGVFPGRSESDGIWSKQFMEEDGNFKVLTYLGQTNHWLASVNVKTSLPGRFPIKLFADIGTYADAANISPTGNTILFDAGVILSIIPNMFEIYFPVVMSGDMKENSNLINETYLQKIRFTLSLEKLSPLKLVRGIEF